MKARSDGSVIIAVICLALAITATRDLKPSKPAEGSYDLVALLSSPTSVSRPLDRSFGLEAIAFGWVWLGSFLHDHLKHKDNTK
jgi:hypothetical protein